MKILPDIKKFHFPELPAEKNLSLYCFFLIVNIIITDRLDNPVKYEILADVEFGGVIVKRDVEFVAVIDVHEIRIIFIFIRPKIVPHQIHVNFQTFAMNIRNNKLPELHRQYGIPFRDGHAVRKKLEIQLAVGGKVLIKLDGVIHRKRPGIGKWDKIEMAFAAAPYQI